MPPAHRAPLLSLDIITVLRALADPVRLDIVRRLETLGEANCAALIGSRPKSSMSHHFQVLRESGIIHTRIEGIHHYNSLRRMELEDTFPGLLTAILAGATGARVPKEPSA